VSAAGLTLAQLRLEQRSFWRNRQAAMFSFALPILLMLLFGALLRHGGDIDGIPFTSYFAAGMIGIAILSATFSNLAVAIAFQRDQLVLKRFRGTPLGAGPLFAAKVANAVLVVALQVAIILALARLQFGTPLPRSPVAFLWAVVAGIVVLSMGGVAMTAFIPNGDSGPAIVQVPYLVLMFISGVFFNYGSEPRWLRALANLFPVRWLLDSVRAGYFARDFLHTRRRLGAEVVPPLHGLHGVTAMGGAYAVLAAWLVVFTVVALRRFRWEPRMP
jgi:ABC-2 type transport system permease protein